MEQRAEVRVPVRDSEIDSAGGVVLDVNGDGLADLGRFVGGDAGGEYHHLLHYARRDDSPHSEPDWALALTFFWDGQTRYPASWGM